MTSTTHDSHDADRSATWEKPGPGTWELDSSHSGPAPGPILRNLFQECLARGFAEGCALFGAPLKGMEMRWVNGKFYRRLVPLVGGDKDLPTPPSFVLKLVTRLHPAFRRQEKIARETLETKRWRDELRRWDTEWKPEIVKANLGFADVDVATLSDPELAAHLGDLHAHLTETTSLHFRLHVSDMGPLGDLMVHLQDWGLSRHDTFRALVAASPATRAPAAQLRRLAAAVAEAGVDPTTLSSLDEVEAASPQAAALLAEYLRFHGWRLTTGYDVEDRCLIELPAVVLACIRSAAPGTAGDGAGHHGTAGDGAGHHGTAGDGAGEVAALREEVPAEHRATFDELVEDARLSYGLRDENGPITYEWPAGLLRRGLLEAGRRLAGDGRLAAPGDVFELAIDEVVSLLRGDGGPTLQQVAERAAERRRWAALEAPARLGPEEPPPPVEAMPPNLGRFTRIVLTVVDAVEAEKGREPLTGMGIGSEPYVGTARVVHDAAEALAEVEPGDVLVAPYTAPTYNAVLAMAGAIVTEEGGLLCHAAVIARELQLPAVIGAEGAMSRITDGATVEVDPVAGRVRVLG